MKTVKSKVSFTIDPSLLHMLDQAAEAEKTSKSALLEKAVKILMEKMLEEEAGKIASMQVDDPAIEEAWLNNISPIPEWEWKE